MQGIVGVEMSLWRLPERQNAMSSSMHLQQLEGRSVACRSIQLSRRRNYADYESSAENVDVNTQHQDGRLHHRQLCDDMVPPSRWYLNNLVLSQEMEGKCKCLDACCDAADAIHDGLRVRLTISE